MDHTSVLPANYTMPAFLRKRSPDGATRNWGSRHMIATYYSFIDPERDERLSGSGWLTYSGWFTHMIGHPSVTGWAQGRESSPAKDRRSTAELRNHYLYIFGGSCPVTEFCQVQNSLCVPSIAFSYVSSVTAQHLSSRRQPKFATW